MWKFLTLILILASSINTQASEKVIYSSTDSTIDVAAYIAIFQDSTNNISISQILDHSSKFQPSNMKVLNFDNTSTTIWLRFDFKNLSGEPVILQCENPEIEHFELFEVIDNHVVSHEMTGLSEAYFKRYLRSNKISLPIKHNEATIYLKVVSGSTIYLPITIGSVKAIASQNHSDDLFNGAVIGIMLLLLLYNLFLFVSIKDQLYLRYCLYLFCSTTMILALEGLHIDLFPSLYKWLMSSHIPNTTVWATTSCALWFSSGFLNLKTSAPKSKYINYGLLILLTISVLIDYMGNRLIANILIQTASGLTSVYLFVLGIYLLIKGRKSARFYVISWGVLVSSAVVYILTINGLIEVSFLTINSFQLGSMLEGGLLSFALADRINQYRIEKLDAQKLALQAAQKNERLIRDQNVLLEEKVDQRTKELQIAKQKSDDLLLNILPSEVAEELKESGHADAKLHEDTSVLFTDFVNFTRVSEQITAAELVNEIDQYYRAFDVIVEAFELEKIKTIGDSYLAVCGLPLPVGNHAIQAVRAAFKILDFIAEYKQKGGRFDVRIGINSGPVVAGIVGVKKFAYDIWGDTVNTAARMESQSLPGKINISRNTYDLIKDSTEFSFEPRGEIEVKGKGKMDMYFVNRN